ncbi:alcohol dehydrogenase catalytic domain-containing protein [Actinopolyspora mortivallis]|uniref:alcohol dehydrogenase catalytic domain-containing protein n=1 Tax=Actinopolyspora mortivallis TaxID=33906 RepID=UPI00035F63A5|nr:alcohol dehydrogenase catalytic domain-containing protein [Actinopolyspora mortivallis]
MRVVVFRRHGPAEDVLELVDVPVPVLGPGQVRIRLRARPVGPSDLCYVAGTHRRPVEVFPTVPGFGGCGVVDAVWEEVTLECGTRVATPVTGTWQEYVAVDVADLVVLADPVPDSVACRIGTGTSSLSVSSPWVGEGSEGETVRGGVAEFDLSNVREAVRRVRRDRGGDVVLTG